MDLVNKYFCNVYKLCTNMEHKFYKDKKVYVQYRAKRADATITKENRKTIGKYVEVTFKGLPLQDYAKCKALVELLELHQYTQTTFNDLQQAHYFLELLTPPKQFFVVKEVQGMYNNGLVMYNIARVK